ncbi:hypothetical protein Leryth_021291 [Lithospermum erythrorhizon]|nr:hypothetical protein Leryth_021291 [Lithospermum erythrorhizon]
MLITYLNKIILELTELNPPTKKMNKSVVHVLIHGCKVCKVPNRSTTSKDNLILCSFLAPCRPICFIATLLKTALCSTLFFNKQYYSPSN